MISGAVGGGSAGLLGRLGDSLLSQLLDRGVHVVHDPDREDRSQELLRPVRFGSGDGVLQPSGWIMSIIGAVVALAIYSAVLARKTA